MTQADYSPLIVSLFLDNPEEYNESVAILLKRLKTTLQPQELEIVLGTVQKHLRNIEVELEQEFNLLLMEHHIAEGLREYKTMSVEGAAYELIMLGVKFPRLSDGRPALSNNEFWLWFDELPQAIRQEVWKKAGYPLYAR